MSYNQESASSSLPGKSLYETCSGEGYLDVTGWSPNYTADQGTITLQAGNTVDLEATTSAGTTGKMYPYTYHGLVSVNETEQTYDAHYLVGNYYQFNAATAGTGEDSGTANAPSSICPKGWVLPRGGNGGYNSPENGARDSDNGTYYNLLNGYGLTRSLTSSTDVWDYSTIAPGVTTLRNYTKHFTPLSAPNGKQITYDIVDGKYNVAAAPLYFVRAGSLYAYGSGEPRLRSAGASASIASATYAGSKIRYVLQFNDIAVIQSQEVYNFYRPIGTEVRCLAN